MTLSDDIAFGLLKFFGYLIAGIFAISIISIIIEIISGVIGIVI